MKRLSSSIGLLLAAAFVLSACGPAAYATNLYNDGQAKYIGATKGYSDFVACQTYENQNIEQTMKLTYTFDWTVLQQNEKYRAAKNALPQAAAAIPTSTADDGTKVVDFNKLPSQATPNGIYSSGLAFSVYAVQEAQVIPVSPEVTNKAMDAVQVSNNHKFQCALTWNNAAADYNLWRRQVSGRVVGDLANYFHIEDMPKTLPLFSADSFAPGAAPNTDNPYAPTAPAAP